MSRWYIHKLSPVLGNLTQKIRGDFEVKTDHQALARKPNLVLINKKTTCHLVDSAVLAEHSENIDLTTKDSPILKTCERLFLKKL